VLNCSEEHVSLVFVDVISLPDESIFPSELVFDVAYDKPDFA
jgi:hypothetical protein